VNQDERLDAIIGKLADYESLREIEIPPELAQPSSFLKVLKARHYNWESEHFRKVFGMRFGVKIPPIEQLNSIFYPHAYFETPIFIFFLLQTKRKVIAHLNVVCPFTDEKYLKKWVDPLAQILAGYPSFESDDRTAEWMRKYRNDSTIYGLFPLDRLDDVSSCCFDYLDYYVSQLASVSVETDPDRLATLNAFHEKWIDDIRTQDKAQGMIAKMIGAKKARRIFYEVTT